MKGPFTLRSTVTDGNGREFAVSEFKLEKQADLVMVQKAISDALNALGAEVAKGK